MFSSPKFVSFRLANDDRDLFVVSDAIQNHIDVVRMVGNALRHDSDAPFTVLGAGSIGIGEYQEGFGIGAYGASTSVKAAGHANNAAREEDSALINASHQESGFRFIVRDTYLSTGIVGFSNAFTDDEIAKIESSLDDLIAKGHFKAGLNAHRESDFESFNLEVIDLDYAADGIKSTVRRTFLD